VFDTVILSLEHRILASRELSSLGFTTSCGHDGSTCRHRVRWKLNQKSECVPQVTWTTAPDRRSYLVVSASLPKMLFGSNVQMLGSHEDIKRALAAISDYVSEAAQVNFAAQGANVSRLDLCFNWRIKPTEVYQYLRAVQTGSLPRMTRDLFGDGTVQFSNKSQCVTFYDKLLEVRSRGDSVKTPDDISGSGLLRFEKRFLGSRACERLAKRWKRNRQAENLLVPSLAEKEMNRTLQDLGLDRTMVSADVRLERLLSQFEPRHALDLAGFLLACDCYGADNLVRLGICKKSTYYRMRNDLKLADVWLVSEPNRTLTPLRIVDLTTQAQAA
jgi:hypothetical protein